MRMIDTGVDEGKISPIWSNATLGDIGSGFRPASRRSQEVLLQRSAHNRAQKQIDDDAGRVVHSDEKALRQADRMRRNGEEATTFILGSSRFIFYHLRIDVAAKDAKSKASRKPRVVVSDNPLLPDDRKEFVMKIGQNIQTNADFFWKEILPITNSMLSAVKRVDDFSQQTIDEKSGLPVEYIKRKMTEAVNLRIIRHVSERFGLNKAEQRLMSAEFHLKIRSF